MAGVFERTILLTLLQFPKKNTPKHALAGFGSYSKCAHHHSEYWRRVRTNLCTVVRLRVAASSPLKNKQ